MSDEIAIYKTKPHWIYLARPAFLILVGFPFVGLGLYGALFEQTLLSQELSNGLMFFGGFVFLLAMFMLIVISIGYRAWNLIITNRRVIFRSGIFKRHTSEVYLRQIESLLAKPPLFGRLFNYGTVIIVGATGKVTSIVQVGEPDEICHRIDAARSMPQKSVPWMHCSHCGEKNAIRAKFCRGCGSQF